MSSDATRPTVEVVGLGPAGPDLTTGLAADRLASADVLRLRTHRHPAAAPHRSSRSYDEFYEAAPTFELVYRRIVDDLAALAADHGVVTYAVPGSPWILERTTRLLLDDDRVDVEVVPGMSFLDLAWGHLGVDPVEAGVTLVDGHRFAVDAAGATGPLLVAHCHAAHVLSDIKLAYDEDEPDGAVVLARLGLPDESVTEVDWADLDRAVEADHLTSIYIPEVGAPVARELVRFEELVRTLRSQCPWDREQTHASLRRYALEETYEVLEAIDGLDPASGAGAELLEEELGDLLYQVFFHAAIAAEAGQFTIADVARGIHDKLHRRHPHVFGDASADSLEADWEAIKKAEKGRASVFDGVPDALPALLYAHQVISKSERIGVAVPAPRTVDGDLGSALLAIVAQARADGLDAEAELRAAARALRDEAQRHERRRVRDGNDTS